jgi:ribosomal protein S18 acetylase RimI-like enzyme
MTIDDYDAVAALWRACPGVGLSDSDTREGVGRFIEKNPGMSLVAVDGEAVVGAVLCGHDGRRGNITHLAVDPSRRERSLGRALVERCIEALGRESIDKCHVFVFDNNHDAIAFWRAIDWIDRVELRVLSRYTR